jgi:hypothetical protein
MLIIISSEVNIIAMRLGPGKHLQGRTLMNGTVAPEEFDYFHEVQLSYLDAQPINHPFS